MNKLRVWHIQNPPNPAVWHDVDGPAEAIETIEALAQADLRNRAIWGNAFGLCMLEDDEWVEWDDGEGNDIDAWAEKEGITRDHDA